MFYSFSVKEFKTCLQYGLINKREACFNLGRGDGKGCKGRKVRFNSVQEEQDGQLYCDFFLLFFFLGWWGEPGSPWEMPDALLRSAVWAQLPREAENEEKTIQEEFWQKRLQNNVSRLGNSL